jgi:hypothetical protein
MNQVTNYSNSILLKKILVEIAPNVNLGQNNLKSNKAMNVYLPAGTLLESGNVRIPYDKEGEDNSSLELLNNDGVNNDCNNQNIIYFSDNKNDIFSTIPSNLDFIPAGNDNQVCYCLVPENSDLIMCNNLNIKLSQDHWCTLNKGTKVKLSSNSQVEFRVNGNWHRIKLIKDEFFQI